MIELDCIQGSPEWDRARLGIITSSEFGRILTPKTRKVSAQAAGYINELVAEWALGYREEGWQGSYWTERGSNLEAEAAAYYDMKRGLDSRPVGLCYLDEQRLVAASPDRMVDPDGLLELKCPMAKTHVGWLLEGGLPAEHVPQAQGQLWVTKRAWVDFMSYHPELPPLLVRVEPDPEWQKSLDEQIPLLLEALCLARTTMLGYGIEPKVDLPSEPSYA